MRYRAECKDCGKESMESLSSGYTAYWAEQHAMQTGHTQIEFVELI